MDRELECVCVVRIALFSFCTAIQNTVDSMVCHSLFYLPPREKKMLKKGQGDKS
jgi:hypothetical protein